MKNKLTYQNDWCSHVYSVEGRQISILKKVVIEGKEYDVHAKTDHVTYGDMGHTYDAVSTQFEICVVIHRVEIWIPLNHFTRQGVEIEALEFTEAK
jgi:hypothetical protein